MIVKEEFECNLCKMDFEISKIGILASLDDSCSPFSDMFCYCRECMFKRLELLLTEMKVPAVKHKDYDYLIKIVRINYYYHEHYNEVSKILKAISFHKDR